MGPGVARRNPLETPMIRQYLELKASVPDAILFFRMGDFYEMFLEDAQKAAPLLGIQLTSRNKGDPDEVPLCGFPYHQLEEYLVRLVAKDLKVAICEQEEDLSSGKKILRRRITRVVTPGLFTQGDLALGQEAHRPRYLVALYTRLENGKKSVGFSALNIATGEFKVTEWKNQADASWQRALQDELARLAPAEILLEEDSETPGLEFISIPQTIRPCRYFEQKNIEKRLAEFFDTQSLDGFGCEGLTVGLGAAHGILEYVRETQKTTMTHIRALLPYSIERTLQLDSATRRHLELTQNSRDGKREGTLLHAMDLCLTRQGSRLLEQWLSAPLVDIAAIDQRLDAVEEFLQGREEGGVDLLSPRLREIADLERLCSRISLGTITPRDALSLGQSLQVLPDLEKILFKTQATLLQECRVPFAQKSLQDLAAEIIQTISDQASGQWKEGGFIRDGVHDQLDELRNLARNTKGFISEIEKREREATGIQSLKVRYNRVFGYYLEVTKSNLKQVPNYFIRKQTLVNAERYIVPDLKEIEEKLLHAEENALRIEHEIFTQCCEKMTRMIPDVLAAAHAVSKVDVLFAFARLAKEWNYVRPQFAQEKMVRIQEGRHVVLEQLVRSLPQAERFIPNDLEMDVANRQILLITGPNMAGKSTIMRQLALMIIMAQMGSFVPARQALMGIVDRIFTRVGASDHLALGQSTFMVEMNETANILHHATARSLVILDEIGRGTSTFDGLSIAWAVAEHLHEVIGARTLFATHYHELAELPRSFPRVINCNVAVKEWNEKIIFLRKLQEGSTNRSYGIQVARLAGLPEPVLKRAREILGRLQEGRKEILNGEEPESQTQIPLFAASSAPQQHAHLEKQSDEVLQDLRQINLSDVTPMQALNLLADWQSKVRLS